MAVTGGAFAVFGARGRGLRGSALPWQDRGVVQGRVARPWQGVPAAHQVPAAWIALLRQDVAGPGLARPANCPWPAPLRWWHPQLQLASTEAAGMCMEGCFAEPVLCCGHQGTGPALWVLCPLPCCVLTLRGRLRIHGGERGPVLPQECWLPLRCSSGDDSSRGWPSCFSGFAPEQRSCAGGGFARS